MTKELEPCPFCGGEAEEIEPSNSSPFWEIHCKKCWATMAGTHRGINQKKWNTRYKRTCKPYQTPDGWTCPVCNWSGLNWGVQKCCSGCGTQLDWR